MTDLERVLPDIYVQPGESQLVREPTILRTVLGSCVGVVFLVPRLCVGALCHPMLPCYPGSRIGIMNVASGRRYVDFAIRDMARQLDALEVDREEAHVKLFGGGDVLAVVGGGSRPTVGKLNCEAALRVLKEEGFAISASRLGGSAGVHIQIQTGTGEVLLRRLRLDVSEDKHRLSRAIHRSGRRLDQ